MSLALISPGDLPCQGEGGQVDMTIHDDRCLLAVQGPAAMDALAPLIPALDLAKFYFSNFAKVDVDGIPCFVTRTGCGSLSSGAAVPLCRAWASLHS